MEFKTVGRLPIDVKETIKRRVSTRSYEEKSLTKKDKRKLIDFNASLTNPFGVDVKVQYISKDKGAEDVQLGTYGTIRGAKDFLAITVKDQPYAMEAVGYQFENLVLYATDMGLGTVWLAGTFNRKDFKNVIEISDEDLFPCICPVGYPGQKRSFIEKITRVSLGSKKRKEWDKLFFLDDFSKSLTKEDAGRYTDALDMLRLAPSATNAQPWAVVKEGDKFHFFCNYKNSINNDVKKIKHLDLGIALSHFHQTAMSDGLNGKLEVTDIDFDVPENMHYMITYMAE
ncbi:MAG: nitroreductase family protein [Peptostreptococcus sp.]|uniref:nitroreductase family protein n=1 Tax=Peptostreptococcus sp. TaxID=1262 RepID=UPI001CAD023A|nr:nitroreductase family protein [Peptostreptococcus sp.]MBF1044814.1 nitroreductase family protein [Peptostreptococcus sp.]